MRWSKTPQDAPRPPWLGATHRVVARLRRFRVSVSRDNDHRESNVMDASVVSTRVSSSGKSRASDGADAPRPATRAWRVRFPPPSRRVAVAVAARRVPPRPRGASFVRRRHRRLDSVRERLRVPSYQPISRFRIEPREDVTRAFRVFELGERASLHRAHRLRGHPEQRTEERSTHPAVFARVERALRVVKVGAVRGAQRSPPRRDSP